MGGGGGAQRLCWKNEQHAATLQWARAMRSIVCPLLQELTNAGIDGIDDCLGGAATGGGLLNPMVVEMKNIFFLLLPNGDPGSRSPFVQKEPPHDRKHFGRQEVFRTTIP